MKARYYVLTLAYCAGIFWMSSQSHPPQVRVSGADKLAHLAMYGGLAAIVSWGLRRSERPVPPHIQFLLPILVAALYGLSDEIHQIFVPRRHFDLLDVLADTAGAVLVQVLLCRLLWRLPLRAAPLGQGNPDGPAGD